MPDLADDDGIARLARGFLARDLPKARWTHAAHFATTLWLLRHRPDLATPEGLRVAISGYNAAVGGVNSDIAGYHHTITRASLGAAAAHLRGYAPNTTLADVLRDLMAGPLGRPGWLSAHWRSETLMSVAARRDWRDPDLAPLPFPA